MHVVWRRKLEFESFVSSVASRRECEDSRLYILVAVVETYFELVTQVLQARLGSSHLPKQSKRIQDLKTATAIDSRLASIMDQVRCLRNDLLHDLLYEPDMARLKAFKKICFGEELSAGDEAMLQEADQREWYFAHLVTRAYAEVYNALESRVGAEIANYLATIQGAA